MEPSDAVPSRQQQIRSDRSHNIRQGAMNALPHAGAEHRSAAAAGVRAVLQRRRYWSSQRQRSPFWLETVPMEGDDNRSRGSREGAQDSQDRRSSASVPVVYHRRFKLYSVFTLAASAAWLASYAVIVFPAMEKYQLHQCTSDGGSSLPHNATMLFFYFIWFAVTRLFLFVPCVVQRVTLALVNRIRGRGHLYILQALFRDMPLYLYAVGAVLFMFYLAQSESCRATPELYNALRLCASSNCLMVPVAASFAVWHNMIFFAAASRSIVEQPPSVPKVNVADLETITYRVEDFGDEEGRPFPSCCSICLGTWEEGDCIKITPCRHIFHEECLATWLQSSCTCAMCRKDLSQVQDPAVQTLGALV
eukprot:TRINITY_DN79595_c0_g1_i1.p1 TRINITY_DN79595_c0_g1~~TRINITY_DN79595_c0_g1_i1.p1  ORF type:complete len:383 (-),score=46.78 TRINITY_DN79595_c0_g1_i1:167-1255(-)